jgi:formylglycine-generating enzyme required for sulfatase activity
MIKKGIAIGVLTVISLGYSIIPTRGDAVTYPVVDTGQEVCYNASGEIACPVAGEAFYGQDAQRDGNQPSYTLSADSLTVYDNVTGLTWMASPDGNLDGTLESPGDKFSWSDAMDFPATLNAQSYGGYDDWRLPSIKELYSLIDFSGLDPSGPNPTNLVPFIDTDYYEFVYGDESQGERIIDSQYWTTTEYVWTTMHGDHTVFGVNFADGRIKGYGTYNPMGGYKLNFALCVRGNIDYGMNDFTDNGDGTVTDAATGLMWQQDDSGVGMQWQDALAYAESLSLAGHDDWRLPNAKELQSVVDYTRSPDYSGSAAIDPVFSCTGNTNETLATDYPWYWTGTTHANLSPTPGGAAAYVCFGRGMGYMSGSWVDAHGAGCQRSDPKDGELSDYSYAPYGYYFGDAPQGDAIRLFNYVRCVRDAGSDSGVGDRDIRQGRLESHPNPFKLETTISFSLPRDEIVRLTIYNVLGEEVTTMADGCLQAGEHRYCWQAADLPSGLYFCFLEAGRSSATKKLTYLP